MRLNVGAFRPVVAVLTAGVMVLGAAPPAAAAPRRAEQWYLDELRIDRAHKLATGRGVLVAVVDTGVDGSHPDIAGRLVAGGRTDGRGGDARSDPDGHGTHMAGIIAATDAARDGVVGIAPDARILPIGISARKRGGVTNAASAAGIRLAADRGAKVINLSYGSMGAATDEEVQAVRYALQRDAVVVAAAGNTDRGDSEVNNPANIPGVIAVTGTTKGGGFWSGSVQGPEAVVAAPGDSIYNIGPEHGYGWGDGTSDATAIVSGIAALIRSRYPDLDAANVINRIIRTARDAGAPGRDPQYGFGRIDPVAALTAKVPKVSANPLLDAKAASPAAPQAGEDDNFDVTRYGDRGGPSDQQVMVVGIGIAVVLVILLALAIFLIWNRRRYRREAARAADVPDEMLDRMAAEGHPAVPAGYAPPGVPPGPGGYGPPPGRAPSPGYPPPGGYPPPPGYAPPPGGPPAPPPGGNRS